MVSHYFSGESYFRIVDFGRYPWVIRNLKEEDYPDCIDDVERSGRKGVIVWGFSIMRQLAVTRPPGWRGNVRLCVRARLASLGSTRLCGK